MGTPTPKGASVEAGFQERLLCLKGGDGCPKKHHGYPGGVELVLGLY